MKDYYYSGTTKCDITVANSCRAVLKGIVLCVSVELRNVVTVPVYTLSVIAAVFAAFLLAGYHTNAARFVELQYGYDYQHAWFYTNGTSICRTLDFLFMLLLLIGAGGIMFSGCPSVRLSARPFTFISRERMEMF